MTKKKRIAKLALSVLLTACILAVLLAVFVKTGISWRCPFNLLTGLNCPGCGSTRAVMEYLKLNFASAFRLNMMFPLEAAYIIYVLTVTAARYVKNGSAAYAPPCKAVDITVLIIIILWWIVRNILSV